MSSKIFINYRRGDDPGFTHALYLQLEAAFSADQLFMDVEIKPGDDFVEVLSARVAECDVLLAVIGPRWVEHIKARTADVDDFVQIEIKAALDQGKRVIPVLVGRAKTPPASELPEVIATLARRQAVELRPEQFNTDCKVLISELKAFADERLASEIECQQWLIRTLNEHADQVNSVAFSPDGRLALSGSEDGTLKLWDLSGV